MGISSIEWTDVTDNIIVAEQGGWWCKHVTAECDNCYAEKLNQSDYFKGNHLQYAGTPPPMKLREDVVAGWARQTKPKKHFVESMSDVFGEWVPRSWIFIYLDGMRLAARQTFQVLTKRPAIMRREVLAWLEARGLSEVPPNIWLGVSAGSQESADAFVPIILDIPAVLFLSCEPMLGRVDVRNWLPLHKGDRSREVDALPVQGTTGRSLAWVICGGESGPKARPMHPDWARSLRDQCAAAGVPFFFKQWGEWVRHGSVDAYTAPGGKRNFPNSPGIAWLADGRICLRDFTVAEHTERIRTGAAHSARVVTADPGALGDFDAHLKRGDKAHRACKDGPCVDECTAAQKAFDALGYEWMYRVGKKAAGRLLDGVTHDGFPAPLAQTEGRR